jgi:hypothetical protein
MIVMKCDLDVSGIYCYQNRYNHKVYIGQVQRFRTRFRAHHNALRRGEDSEHFQNGYNKDGDWAWKRFVVEYCPIAMLDEREQYYLDDYKAANPRFGYNLSPTAGSSILELLPFFRSLLFLRPRSRPLRPPLRLSGLRLRSSLAPTPSAGLRYGLRGRSLLPA